MDRFFGYKNKGDLALELQNMTQRLKAKPEPRRKAEQPTFKPKVEGGGGLYCTCDDFEDLVNFNLSCLRRSASMYDNPYHYGPQEEKRLLVWPGGSRQLSPTKTSGVSWVGVNGAGPAWVACVGDSELDPYSDDREQLPTSTILPVSLARLTDVDKFRHLIPKSHQEGPFAIVSIAPLEDSHQVTKEQLDCGKHACSCLESVLQSGSQIYYLEDKEVVVRTLEFLMDQNLTPSEVEVACIGFGKKNTARFQGKLSDYKPFA